MTYLASEAKIKAQTGKRVTMKRTSKDKRNMMHIIECQESGFSNTDYATPLYKHPTTFNT